MIKFGVGQAVRRTEDLRLLRGAGRYLDDITLPKTGYIAFLRSPHAHARIVRIDATAAKAAPGVLGVFTGADLQASGLGTVPCMVPLKNRDGSKMEMPPRPVIAVERVRYVGDTVAMVVAASVNQAKDAAELIEIEYDTLPHVADTAAALSPGAAQIWEKAKGNLAFDWALGDEAATAAAFKRAHRVVGLDLINNRLVPNTMEPRGAIAEYSTADERFTLYVSTQGGHGIRQALADVVFKIPPEKIRVVTRDVGGGFGMKIFLYPEYAAAMWAARAIGLPVKWTGERSDAFVSDTHGRDHVTCAEMAVDANGKFLGVRVTTTANMGAYLSHFSTIIPTVLHACMIVGIYTIPAAFVSIKGVYTNTVPVDAYRGAGRPEAAYVIERLIDHVAREIGVAPDEIRRRNFIPPTAMPYQTALGMTYDSGEFARNMADAMKAADWAGFAARKAASTKAGKLRGIGLATYVEACGGSPDETAQVRFERDGAVSVLIGNMANGQGHETAYAQMVTEWLGVPFESVRIVQGDTDVVTYGRGTGGSRAASVGGTAILGASQKIIDKGKKLAGHLLETAEADIEFAEGMFSIVGTDRRMSIVELAKASFDEKRLPPGMKPGLDENSNFLPAAATFPNGCHIVEVEIDPATGVASVLGYTVVDDFGRVINPLLVAGQVHGGVVQGVGQALLEGCVYDVDSGQLLTGSFMDYCMPRADNVPFFSFAYNEIPCQSNPLGVKGCGEAGSIGAPPAVINAVVDALTPHGIKHVDMPATPQKLWGLIRSASLKTAAE